MNTKVVGARPGIGRMLLAMAGSLCLVAASAQGQREVSGRVVDAQGNVPIQGVSVLVSGTTLGATTNDSGAFHINGVPGTAITLNARRIGYRPGNLAVAADQNGVTIPLTQDVLQLEAQVITGAATTISSRNSANDIPVLSSQDVNRVPAPTLENALQGKIPGAQVAQNNGGAPGGGLQVQIRGVTSINADANPLYVIDGVIIDNQTINSGEDAITGAGNSGIAQDVQDNSPNRIADLNPNDIESIEVLKGASASAIYGSRAGSGVVVITTKKGVPGKAKWDLTGRVGTQDMAHTIPLKSFPTLASAQSWYLGVTGDTTAATISADNATIAGIYAGPQNYQNQLFGNHSASYEGDLSVRGVQGATTYFVSAMSKYDAGVLVNTGYNKQAARTNFTEAFSNALTGTLNLYYQHSLTVRGITGNDNVGIAPYNVFSTTPQFLNLNTPANGAYPNNPFGFANPFADAYDIETPEDVQRFIGGANIAWRVFSTEHQQLNFTALGGSDLANQTDREYSPPYLQVEQHKALPGTVTASSGTIGYTNWALNLVHHYAGGSNVDATSSIGMTRDQRSLSNPNAVGQDLPPGISTPTAGSVQTLFDLRQASRTMAFYAQEQLLTLDQRLTLGAGITAERSTNNGNIGRYYPFPKYSLAYRIPQFVGFVDELKIRGAYGVSGTDPNYGVRYPNSDNLNTTLDGSGHGVTTSLTSNDPSIKPETNTEMETGFDATLFNSRAQLTFTVYQKRITNLLLLASIAPSEGFNAQWFNGGQFTNRGAEISLNFTPIQSRGINGLTWVSTVTFARNYSVVDQLPVPGFAAGDQFGGPFGTFWIQQGKSVSWVVNTGITNAAGVPLGVGNAQPDFTMGFGEELNIQHFHLYGLLDWRKGGTTSDLSLQYFDFGPGLGPDDAGAAARVASVFAGGTPYVEPGTFLKLRELTLSYDLPANWVSAIPGSRVSSARLQLSGRNLFVSYPNYHGSDPEASNFGNSNIARGQEVTPYPPARFFFLTLDLGL